MAYKPQFPVLTTSGTQNLRSVCRTKGMGEKGKSMPRVHINKKKYMISDFRVWVIGKMNVLGKSQADMGNLLGISQPAFGKRLKESNFDYSQIITIFKELQATDEEIVKFMKL